MVTFYKKLETQEGLAAAAIDLELGIEGGASEACERRLGGTAARESTAGDRGDRAKALEHHRQQGG